MYRRLIIPLDGSGLAEQILPYARSIADAFEIPVELLRVRNGGTEADDAEQYLKAVAQRAFPASIKLYFSVEAGNPAAVILEHARTEPATLIAMATHGLSGIHGWIMGSVAYKVIHAAAGPVLLVRPSDEHAPAAEVTLENVIVPLDGSGLGECILPHVCALATQLKLKTTLIRAYSLPVDAYLAPVPYVDGFGREREAVKKEIDEYLQAKTEQLRSAGLTAVSPLAVFGDPAGEIIDIARETQNSLIAMCTHGRSGLGRWLIGSVAEKIVQHAHNPVLLVRPQ